MEITTFPISSASLQSGDNWSAQQVMKEATQIANQVCDIPPHIAELLDGASEELLPELRMYYGHSGPFPCVRHPLCYAVPHLPQMNKVVNARYLHKKRAYAEALANADVDHALVLVERPYRAERLLSLYQAGMFDRITDGPSKYWSSVGWVWTDSENVPDCMPTWRKLWSPEKYRIHRSDCMHDEEKAVLSELPDLIEVWHGEEVEGKVGWSWTTDEKVARWFANRFDAGRKVYRGLAPKEKVAAYFARRNESEVLIHPRYVQDKTAI